MFDVKVLSKSDSELILKFENQKLEALHLSDMAREMESWDQPWRNESLDHYLKLGWSFIAKNEGEIQGYILCQPLLFFKNYTQSLWIEYTSSLNEDCASHLIDVACRWAKSKHLQKVFINEAQHELDFLQKIYPSIDGTEMFHLTTTKMSGE